MREKAKSQTAKIQKCAHESRGKREWQLMEGRFVPKAPLRIFSRIQPAD